MTIYTVNINSHYMIPLAFYSFHSIFFPPRRPALSSSPLNILHSKACRLARKQSQGCTGCCLFNFTHRQQHLEALRRSKAEYLHVHGDAHTYDRNNKCLIYEPTGVISINGVFYFFILAA